MVRNGNISIESILGNDCHFRNSTARCFILRSINGKSPLILFLASGRSLYALLTKREVKMAGYWPSS